MKVISHNYLAPRSEKVYEGRVEFYCNGQQATWPPTLDQAIVFQAIMAQFGGGTPEESPGWRDTDPSVVIGKLTHEQVMAYWDSPELKDIQEALSQAAARERELRELAAKAQSDLDNIYRKYEWKRELLDINKTRRALGQPDLEWKEFVDE